MREVVIVGATRTPIGNFGGALGSCSAVDLGRLAAVEAIKRSGVHPDLIEEAIIGSVLAAGLGQNVARQVALKAGMQVSSSAMSLNQVCGSGLRAVSLAAQIIQAGDSEIMLAGGTESMSNAPYLLSKARWGYRMGNDALVDSMVNDGLWDVFNNYHMGITAENVAEKWNITREQQDEFALESQKRAEAAIRSGRFKDEIIPVSIPQRKGEPIVMESDEFPRFGSTMEGLMKLKPAFLRNGTVTAGNASGINDGAAMVVLMSSEAAKEKGIKPLARILSYGYSGVEPELMGIGPITACRKALQKAGLMVKDLDLIEVNEAFAAQSIAVMQELELPAEKTNVNGGAIALGHPIGASGTRILVTLLHELQKREARYGMATLCIGGGQGTAVILERC